MESYQVKGLSCAHCASKLEEKIQKLPNGAEAKLHYQTSRLALPEGMNMPQIEAILATEGVKIATDESTNKTDEQGQPGEHGHSHDHGDSDIKGIIFKIVIAFVLFGVAIYLEDTQVAIIPLILYLVATVLCGMETFVKGIKNLFHFDFTIDTLMSIALIGAFAIGEYREGTLVAILFGINEMLEGMGMMQARKSMASLLKVQPKEATKMVDGTEKVIAIKDLKVDDIVKVKTGEQIPSDGIVVEGHSSVNESAITGESLPVEKQVDSEVFGGSVNNEGVMLVKITRAYQDSSLAKILHLVTEAQETKTPTELFINKFAKYYTPAIMILAILVVLIPPLFLGGDWGQWFYEGLAVLIVGCPCALVLSSPIALVSGITRNAKMGVLVKGGVHIETLSKLDTIAFDKTGTLTKGNVQVDQAIVYDDRLLEVARSIEAESLHPIARAVCEYAENQGASAKVATEVQTVSGKGLTGVVEGITYSVGSEKQISSELRSGNVQSDIERLKADGKTLVLVADESHILGIFGLSDEIREESKALIRALHQTGIKKLVMLTGDHAGTAKKVGEAIGIDHIEADLLPEQKVEYIEALTKEGLTGMVGDGINDSPALVKSDLGIAMGKGTDSAIEVADVVLMQDHLGKLPATIRIAKRVNRVIKFNIFFAIALKLSALILTIPGLLTLWYAILADMGATVIVTIISLTILIKRKNESGEL